MPVRVFLVQQARRAEYGGFNIRTAGQSVPKAAEQYDQDATITYDPGGEPSESSRIKPSGKPTLVIM